MNEEQTHDSSLDLTTLGNDAILLKYLACNCRVTPSARRKEL